MKDLKKILRFLEANGFRITYNDGTKRKLYPPRKDLPFYSLHMGEKAIDPLTSFARKNWGMDLTGI